MDNELITTSTALGGTSAVLRLGGLAVEHVRGRLVIDAGRKNARRSGSLTW